MAILNDQRKRGLRQLWRSGEGPSLVAALLFCVITSIFMAPLLPAEDGYGVVGILFIYVTIFVLVGGIFKMAIRPAMRWREKSRAGSNDAA